MHAVCELFLTAGAEEAPALRSGADRLFQPPSFVPHAARFQRAPVQMKNLHEGDLVQVDAACELFLTAGAAKTPALRGRANRLLQAPTFVPHATRFRRALVQNKDLKKAI